MRLQGFVVILVLILCMSATTDAATWPEIPESDWALRKVETEPRAPAVVLNELGRLVLDENALSSYLEVYRRVKILTDDGVEYGSVSLWSSDSYRMKDLEARTHRPDRSVVDLPKDAVFEKRYSQYYRRAVVSFAMPEVTTGSIVEYRYRVFFDSVLYPEPWYFQSELPVLMSEVQCVIPTGYAFRPYLMRTLATRQIESETFKDARGLTAVFRMRDMPPIPDEPSRFPFSALSSYVLMLPLSYTSGIKIPLLETWESAVEVIQGNREYGYKRFRLRNTGVGSKVKELSAGVSDRRQVARVLYEFVRDQLVTEPYEGIGIGKSTAAEVLDQGRGDLAEKGLLLQHMLDSAKIDASVGWTSPCTSVRLDPEVPNLGQFERVIVVATLDGQRVFLDPSDRSLAFGTLPPELEGVPCLLVDTKKPEWVTTPSTPAEVSARTARLTLAVDDDGRVAGTGTLDLGGHEAWRRLLWKDTPDETTKAWDDWLEERFPGYDVGEVKVTESVSERHLQVTWAMGLRDEEVLGDEVTISPAAPLAVTSNPFTLPSERRLTPVLLDFPSVDTVELELTWGEGWTVGNIPAVKDTATAAGGVSTRFEVDPAARRLRSTRTASVTSREFIGLAPYSQLRRLFQAVVENDSLNLLLTR